MTGGLFLIFAWNDPENHPEKAFFLIIIPHYVSFWNFQFSDFGWKKMLVVIICVFDKLGYTWPVEECNIGLKK